LEKKEHTPDSFSHLSLWLLSFYLTAPQDITDSVCSSLPSCRKSFFLLPTHISWIISHPMSDGLSSRSLLCCVAVSAPKTTAAATDGKNLSSTHSAAEASSDG
jgi:hypothetical protein